MRQSWTLAPVALTLVRFDLRIETLTNPDSTRLPATPPSSRADGSE